MARIRFLTEHPFCAMCERLGRTMFATVVDHTEPHKGDLVKFWDESNWQSACKPCHDGAKQEQEKSGTIRGSTRDGLPVDPGHPWNR